MQIKLGQLSGGKERRKQAKGRAVGAFRKGKEHMVWEQKIRYAQQLLVDLLLVSIYWSNQGSKKRSIPSILIGYSVFCYRKLLICIPFLKRVYC